MSRCYRPSWRNVAPMVVVAAVVVLCLCRTVGAQDVKSYNLDTFHQWMSKYQNAKPDFKAGDVLTAKDTERMRPFIIPGYLEQLNFPEFQMPIQPVQKHTPRHDYMECTEKYQNQVKLKSDGTLENYVCGQPFPDSALDVNDPTSGLKAAWDFEYRWQNYGFMGISWNVTWVRFGGDHHDTMPSGVPDVPPQWIAGLKFTTPFPSDLHESYGGGGTFQRNLGAVYRRVYFTHLAQEQAHGGVVPIPGAADFEYKEFTGFQAPFDIRGTAFIIYRYNDPYRADDGWAYIPNLRRVRRISAEVKSDSLLGTDHTIEDFYSFAGRPVEWKWKFLGWKDVLAMMDGVYDYTRVYGPNGLILNDKGWSLRKFAVIERTPTLTRHPYSAVLNFWDAENWDSWFEVAFDRKGKLWKIWEYPKKWSETYKDWAELNHGAEATVFQAVLVLDVQNARGTISIAYGAGMPTPNTQQVASLFDINKLEEIHR